MKHFLFTSFIYIGLIGSETTQNSLLPTTYTETRFVPNRTLGLSPEEEIGFASEAAAKITAFHDYQKTIVN